jgi:solute carrier family 25 (adenine nucleotide translocator) protein 4/5/6/31
VLGDSTAMVNTFLLGWAVTIASGLAAYPIDTIKRRMMMTAGQEVSIDLIHNAIHIRLQ